MKVFTIPQEVLFYFMKKTVPLYFLEILKNVHCKPEINENRALDKVSKPLFTLYTIQNCCSNDLCLF